jgi:beta-glucosidase
MAERPVSAASFEARIEALLGRMSLDQKLGQMTQAERMAITPDEVRDFHIGSVLSGGGSTPGENTPADWVAMNDAYWAASTEERPDGAPAIPLLYGVDAIHGHNNVRGATVFPHNIGLGAANDPDLLERIARVTAREILATGVEWTFAPTLAVARDLRWGRTYESYGETPEIVSKYAAAFVRGLQGDLESDSVIACAKHWVGDGGTTGGIDQGETTLTEDKLRAIHIAPYLPALDAGVLTVMASYNSWNGVKCHGHEYLLTQVLKDELGFSGFVISDWDGIDQLSSDPQEAIVLGANAGIDMFMVSVEWRRFIQGLKSGVERGRIPMERIDDAVRRILRVKLACGLFERPRPSQRRWSGHASFGSPEHRAVAREAVRKSLVLLKHEGDVLPLKRDARILVAGKNAHDRGHQCGGFTIAWQGTSGQEFVEGGTSIWEGILENAPDAVLDPDIASVDPSEFDLAVVVIGERPYAEGMGDIRSAERVEPGSRPHQDRADLAPYGQTLQLSALHPEDLEVIRGIASSGTPLVAILVSGRPLVADEEMAASSAFIAAWLPGSEGQGVADVLFGEHDFTGRLSFSWPGSQALTRSQSPFNSEPLFPRGHGLRLTDG